MVRARVAVAFLALMALATGCAASPQVPSPAVTVTVTVTPEAAVSTPSATVVSATPRTAGMSTQASATGPAIISVVPGGERRLSLVDAFGDTSDWQEGSFQAPGSANRVQGVTTSISCSSEELEFRFSSATGRFVANVAQSMESPASDKIQEWTLTLDGRRAETKRISFKESAELAADLTGVAVVKLGVANVSGCASTKGLITSLTIHG